MGDLLEGRLQGGRLPHVRQRARPLAEGAHLLPLRAALSREITTDAAPFPLPLDSVRVWLLGASVPPDEGLVAQRVRRPRAPCSVSSVLTHLVRSQPPHTPGQDVHQVRHPPSLKVERDGVRHELLGHRMRGPDDVRPRSSSGLALCRGRRRRLLTLRLPARPRTLNWILIGIWESALDDFYLESFKVRRPHSLGRPAADDCARLCPAGVPHVHRRLLPFRQPHLGRLQVPPQGRRLRHRARQQS